MKTRVEKIIAQNKEEAYSLLNGQYQNHEIVYEKETKHKVWFWKTVNYEISALIHEVEEKEKEVQKDADKASNSKKKSKEMSQKEKDKKKNEILKMLSEPSGLEELSKRAELTEEEANNSIAELKVLIETLVQKINEDGYRKPLPLPLEKIESYLREQEIDGRTARIFVEKVENQLKDIPVLEDTIINENMQKMIENQINVYGPLNPEKTKIIALVGPTGVGKTTTLAKIGWELNKNNRTVGFITTDNFRSGAKEQLEQYAEIMDAETKVAKSAEDLNEAIKYFQTVNIVDHILIDTVGRNMMNEESVDAVQEYLEVSKPDITALVLSSTSKVKDLKEILVKFKKASVDCMVFTKLDETYNMGSILNVFNYTKLPLLYVTDGQDITKHIYAPTKTILAEKILNKELIIEGKIIAM